MLDSSAQDDGRILTSTSYEILAIEVPVPHYSVTAPSRWHQHSSLNYYCAQSNTGLYHATDSCTNNEKARKYRYIYEKVLEFAKERNLNVYLPLCMADFKTANVSVI